jgi:hypothetical protein
MDSKLSSSFELKWDGTFLGKIEKSQILEVTKFKGDTYWKLQYSDVTVFVMAKSSEHTFACIIDELKPIFNIPKLGTHYCKLGSKIFILIRVYCINVNNILVDVKLKELKFDDPLFNEKVKTIYAFREMLGITVSTGNSIRVRRSEIDDFKSSNELDYYDPISFREPNFSFEKSIISKSVLKTVFNNEYKCLIKYIHHLLNISCKADIKNVLIQMSNTFESVIRAVDPTYLWITNELIMRFNSFMI